MPEDTIITIDKDIIHRYLNNHGFVTLSRMISHIHNKNPYDIDNDSDKIKHIMWNEQCYINFPMLYIASIYLYLYAKDAGCNKFLFVTRDCCHWYKVFKCLFPDEEVHYFHASRNVFEKVINMKNHPYDKYVNDIINNNVDKCIFVDIHGTGKRVFNYFAKKYGRVPHYFLFSATHKVLSDFPAITIKYSNNFVNLLFDIRGSPIEMLNYDLIGTLQDYSFNGPIRDPLEYDPNLINVYHRAINKCLKYISPIEFDMNKSKYNYKNLRHLLKHLSKAIITDKPIISKYIKHIGKHKKNKY